MSKPIQLYIPTPCHENWANMSPSEKGRHCTACQKTVVDFTMMNDTEVLHYMKQAGPHVCGRLAPDQLNRPLIPLTPPQRNKMPGWLLLAGILITSDKSLTPLTKQATHQSPIPPPSDEDRHITVGEVMPYTCDKPLDIVSDTITLTTMGDIAFVPPNPDTIKQTVDTMKQFIIDTLTTLRILPQKDTTAEIDTTIDTATTTDTNTTTFTNIPTTKNPSLPVQNNALTIYPNPVRRGTAFRLSWQTVPGKYQVSLFTPTGALVQQRVIDIGSTKQVNDWQLPTNVPAGIYIVRVVQPGQSGVYARELVVE